MRLRPQYPASFPVLLLAGFTLVALPLLGGMINASYMVERVVAEGRHAIDLTLVLTRSGRHLVYGVSSLQRAAGQYYVLEDAALGRALEQAHRNLMAGLAALLAQPLDPALRRQVAAFAQAEAALYSRLRDGREGGGRRATFADHAADFNQLHAAAVAIESAGQALIDQRMTTLEASAADVRRALLWQALAMIPLSLFLTLLFSWLISRPVRQLAQVIRRLGEDDLTPLPPVEGPRDLAYLGERLDWLRRRLISLEQQQLNFLRHVSHELKTPLANLGEGVALFADGIVGDREQREVAEIMVRNLRELQRRIEDLIQHSRAGSEFLRHEDLRLEDLIVVAARRHELALGKKGIHLEQDLDGAHVRGDRNKLESVFENLLGNALRFSPPGGHIRVKARTTARRVVITVCDQGPGVRPEDRERIFHPFYQGARQPAGALRGSGLGLAIVRETVEAHGGQASLLPSTTAEDGACFQVSLPGPGADHGR